MPPASLVWKWEEKRWHSLISESNFSELCCESGRGSNDMCQAKPVCRFPAPLRTKMDQTEGDHRRVALTLGTKSFTVPGTPTVLVAIA